VSPNGRCLVPFALVAFIFGACHRRAGEDCDNTPRSCFDKTSRLVCLNKKYVLETCKGPGGCTDDGQTLVCDSTAADVGAGCEREGARACSTDGKLELWCRDNKFAVESRCRGGCTLNATNDVKCTPTGEVGDPCRPGSIVCNGEQNAQLVCLEGKLQQKKTCNGALGCQTAPSGGVRCDRTVAVEDEACSEEGTGACDMTRKAVLVCTGGQFKTQMHCLGDLGCAIPGNYTVLCDKSIVSTTEPCDEDGAATCSTEGTQLKCMGSKWKLDKDWKPKKGESCSKRYQIAKDTEKFEAR
jgi:hypothetical protein